MMPTSSRLPISPDPCVAASSWLAGRSAPAVCDFPATYLRFVTTSDTALPLSTISAVNSTSILLSLHRLRPDSASCTTDAHESSAALHPRKWSFAVTEHPEREKLSYNQIAGHSVERLAALSDGVFAVAMTILVLDLRAPAAEVVHSERDLWRALVALAPRLVMYLMSFMTLGIFWVGQQTQLNHLQRSSRSLTWIHLVFLLEVTLTPFSTALLAEHTQYRIALLVYWVNILLLGWTLYWSWVCALGSGLVKNDISVHVSQAIKHRIIIAQSWYFFGALLCFFNPYWSIALILFVQLYYATAPRFGKRHEQ